MCAVAKKERSRVFEILNNSFCLLKKGQSSLLGAVIASFVCKFVPSKTANISSQFLGTNLHSLKVKEAFS